jgi:hypothetical protein
MSEFTDKFFNNEEITENNSSGEKVEFLIKSVKLEKATVFGKEEEAMVFHLLGSDGVKTTIAQGLNKTDGTPRKTLFGEFRWYEGRPVAATVFTDLITAIKEKIGVEKYEERKKECGGINAKFFTGAKFSATVRSGVSKEGNDYYFIQLPSQEKIANWKYLVENRGDFADYKDIPEVQEIFGLKKAEVADNSKVVEETFNDLPF